MEPLNTGDGLAISESSPPGQCGNFSWTLALSKVFILEELNPFEV